MFITLRKNVICYNEIFIVIMNCIIHVDIHFTHLIWTFLCLCLLLLFTNIYHLIGYKSIKSTQFLIINTMFSLVLVWYIDHQVIDSDTYLDDTKHGLKIDVWKRSCIIFRYIYGTFCLRAKITRRLFRGDNVSRAKARRRAREPTSTGRAGVHPAIC